MNQWTQWIKFPFPMLMDIINPLRALIKQKAEGGSICPFLLSTCHMLGHLKSSSPTLGLGCKSFLTLVRRHSDSDWITSLWVSSLQMAECETSQPPSPCEPISPNPTPTSCLSLSHCSGEAWLTQVVSEKRGVGKRNLWLNLSR